MASTSERRVNPMKRTRMMAVVDTDIRRQHRSLPFGLNLFMVLFFEHKEADG